MLCVHVPRMLKRQSNGMQSCRVVSHQVMLSVPRYASTLHGILLLNSISIAEIKTINRASTNTLSHT